MEVLRPLARPATSPLMPNALMPGAHSFTRRTLNDCHEGCLRQSRQNRPEAA
jgi:hypothetical protein